MVPPDEWIPGAAIKPVAAETDEKAKDVADGGKSKGLKFGWLTKKTVKGVVYYSRANFVPEDDVVQKLNRLDEVSLVLFCL